MEDSQSEEATTIEELQNIEVQQQGLDRLRIYIYTPYRHHTGIYTRLIFSTQLPLMLTMGSDGSILDLADLYFLIGT